jgi:hypothetical protein
VGLARELRSRRQIDRRKIEVKAWADESGEPFPIYCRPITCYDLNEIQKKHPKVLESPTVASMVDLIVMKAEDEAGDKLFASAEDRMDLMGEETVVISGIAEEMFSQIESVEAIEKNF